MKLNIEKTIQLFDEKIPENGGHISGVIGLLGEELLIRVFAHYLESLGYQVDVDKEAPKTGKKKGSRLDAWITCRKANESILYQAEVKNWSAYAVGGWSASVNIDDEQLSRQAKDRYDQQYGEHFSNKQKIKVNVNKVLIPMRPPNGTKEIKPVVIYWWPISKDGVAYPFSSLQPSGRLVKRLKSPFKEVNIFSASLYLRLLRKKGEKILDLNLPKTEKRQKLIEQIFINERS